MGLNEVVTIMFLMIGLGILAGFLGSLLGIGGGLIVTPILTWAIGLDIKYTIATSIIVVIATSSGAAISYLKDKVINIRAGMFLEIFTSLGGLCGAILTGIIWPSLLYGLFAFVMIFSAINTIIKMFNKRSEINVYVKNDKIATKFRLNGSYFDKELNQEIQYNVKNIPLGSVIMFGAGLASGLLGIGSGIFKVIAMDNAMKMPLKPSSATSNFMMGVTGAASAIVYFFNGSILPEITIPVVIGVLLGSILGSRIMPKIPNKVMRIMFVIVMLVFAIQMLSKAVVLF